MTVALSFRESPRQVLSCLVTRQKRDDSSHLASPLLSSSFIIPISPESSALCILVDSCTMRAMRSALSVLSRSSTHARAPSRLVSTEAAVEGSIASNSSRLAASRGDLLVKEMTPIATFLGIVVTIGAIGAYYSSRLAALEERMAGTASTLKSDMTGTASTLKSDMAGLKETITKEVDAKNTGTKEAVTKEVDAKIAGFKEAADLKVRFLLGVAHLTLSLTHQPLPPCSTRPSDVLVAVSVVTVSVVFGRCISGIGRCAETKVKHWFKLACIGGVWESSRAWFARRVGSLGGSSTVPGSPVRWIFQGATRACFGGALC